MSVRPTHPCQDHHSQPASAKINAVISNIIANVEAKEVKGSSLSLKDEEDMMELVRVQWGLNYRSSPPVAS
jgi:hypothetical protein